MGAVDGDYVNFGCRQFLGSLQEISSGADGRAYAQASLRIFGGVGILQFLLNVFYGDESLEVVFVVDDEEFFDAMFVENFLGIFESGADGHSDEIFLSHHAVDRNIEAGLEAQVAIGENADEAALQSNGHAGNLVLAHDLQRVANLIGGRHGDRIDDHSAFRALHFVDLVGLLVDSEVAMDNAEPTLLRKRNRHVRFRDRIHGGADNGDVETDVARELGLRVGSGGNYV